MLQGGGYLLQQGRSLILLQGEGSPYTNPHGASWAEPSHSAFWALVESDVAGVYDQVQTIVRGEDATLTFTCDDPPAAGIGDWSLFFTLALRAGDDPLIEVDSAIIIDDAGEGSLSVPIDRAETVDLMPGNYRWDLWRTDTGANVPMAGGVIRVLGSVRSTS